MASRSASMARLVPRRRRWALLALTAAALVSAAGTFAPLGAAPLAPADARAHAVVVDTSPRRSAALDRPPTRVSVRFNEAIESRFGALRVFDVDGDEVQSGSAFRTAPDEIAVRLRPDLPPGAYTATYRVVSADSHPVAGGFTFTVGDPSASAAGVSDLLSDQSAGPITDTAFAAIRVASYAATAALIGTTLFLLTTWFPARRSISHTAQPPNDRRARSKQPPTPDPGTSAATPDPQPRPTTADPRGGRRSFAWRTTRLLTTAALTGAAASAAGLVAQGATAAGTSFWRAFDPGLLSDVLDTRFGEVWGLRLLAFVAIAALVWRWPSPDPARGGVAVGRVRGAALAVALVWLAVSPALAGHAGAAPDSLWLVPLDVAHVTAMSAWVGGIVLIVWALPAATRALPNGDRTRLLAAVLARFSTVALVAVAVLAASGVAQAVLYLDRFDALWDTAFGRALLVKAALFVALLGIGAWHRRRSLPRLRELAARGAGPGRAGVALRRALRGELALFAGVLVATAALVSYAPSAVSDGPFGASVDLGPAQLELTVDPARAGDNELHLYLFDSESGAQFDRPRELTVTATERELDIGPIELAVRRAGPGHYVVARAPLAPAGDWTLQVRAPVSDFEELRGEVEVPIR